MLYFEMNSTFENYVYAFDFSASYSGGGLKRLIAFSKYANDMGGGVFFIHPFAKKHIIRYKNNCYISYPGSAFFRLLPFSLYKSRLLKSLPNLQLYYSYNVPLFQPGNFQRVFHVSNVLPLTWRRFGVPLFRFLQLQYLGLLMRLAMYGSDKICVESNASIEFIPKGFVKKVFVSYNGVDDELAFLVCNDEPSSSARYGVTVGVQPYKNVKRSIQLFHSIKKQFALEKLLVVGGHGLENHDQHKDVEFLGELDRAQVLETLSKSSVYISSTSIENSYNAAAEGVLLSEVSFVSNLSVHRELCEMLCVSPGISEFQQNTYLVIQRSEVDSTKIPTWKEIFDATMQGHDYV